MGKPIKDEFGRYINCGMYKATDNGKECIALKGWYNDDVDCSGCPFFKTKEEYEMGFANYNNRRGLRSEVLRNTSLGL